ncbi:MAG: hypothetical protein QOI31_2965 [Solirubrobacterales bacterium]|nr:hypothetical protein [Solirubrobacterales bacterium]
MTRVVDLPLGEFAKESLERLVDAAGGSRDSAVRTAVLYYLDDAASGRPAWRVPRFRSPPAGELVEVSFDEETWAALDSEAREQETTPESLAVYAFGYYLADLDSGRVGSRLDQAVEPDDA